jgi:hypothetical protein
MKRIGFVAVAGLLWTGTAAAQDTPPPGCRWQNYGGDQILACKDGKGHWRRSGDELIVGTYPLPKPKPKPVPVAAKPAAAPAATATPAAPAAPVAAAADGAPAQPAVEEAAAANPSDTEALSAAGQAVDASVAPSGDKVAEPPVEPPKKPWWAMIWDAILNFLRSIGLLK